MLSYDKYKLEWLIEHNHTIDDLIERIGNIAYTELTNDGSISLDKIINEAFEIFENEIGFQGNEIWVCEDEYNQNDYRE